MNLKSKFIPAMLFAGVIALSSCEKNEQEAMEPTFEQGTIAHILVDSAEVTSFKYNGNTVSQINNFNKENGELESFEKFVMDASGKLIKSSTHAGKTHATMSEQTYSYNSKGELENTNTRYFNNGKLVYSSHATYEYNSDNKLTKKSVYEGDSKDGKLKSFTSYEVLPNGNFGQEKQFVIDDEESAKLFSTTTYSYDTNKNPFFEAAEPGKASSPNNLVASSTVVHNSKKTYAYTYSYQYDERGYPTSQAVVTPSGSREKFTYVYSN